MGRTSHTQRKLDAHMIDVKSSAPPSTMWSMMPSSIAELVEDTNISSTGVKEVLNATSPQDALVQTITHPVILAVVVIGGLLLLRR